jgi:hypothetical protein
VGARVSGVQFGCFGWGRVGAFGRQKKHGELWVIWGACGKKRGAFGGWLNYVCFMDAILPVGAGLDVFSKRSREKLGVLFTECLLKAGKHERRAFVLHSRYLRANYGREYAAFIRYLERIGAVRVVPYACGLEYFDGHSRQFVVCPDFNGELKRVKVSKGLRLAIKRRRTTQADELCKAIEGGVHLVKVWPLLSIDVGAANEHLDAVERGRVALPPSRSGAVSPSFAERVRFRRLAVGWFDYGGLTFNEYTGRVFSPFTNLPSDLRPFLRAEGVERLALVDVSNSQPFMLAAMYAEATNDTRPLECAAAGHFYKAVQALCGLERGEVKRGVLAAIYGKALTPKSEAGRALVRAFPELWEWVCRQRVGAVHLAVRMQRVEASWVLKVAVELARRGAFVTPIHDALLIDAAQVDEAREALAGAAFERWGARPSFGVERV